MAKDKKSELVVHSGKKGDMSLLNLAITEKVPVEILERVMVMQDKYDAKIAKEEYYKALSDFQNECPTIGKKNNVTDNTGKHLYKFASLESIISEVKPLLKKHGFSYSINTEVKNDMVKSICKVHHKGGHSEISEMAVPSTSGTKIMSAPQKVAGASTFSKRYAFINAFGIMTGENDSGEGLEDPKKFQADTLQEAKGRLVKAVNEKQLITAWANLPASSKRDPKIKTYKDELKSGFKDAKGRVEETKGVRMSAQEEKEIIAKEKKEANNG